jgi:hypothetical protein
MDLHLGVVDDVADGNDSGRRLHLVIEGDVGHRHITHELRRVTLEGIGVCIGMAAAAIGGGFPQRLPFVIDAARDPFDRADLVSVRRPLQHQIPPLGEDAVNNLPRSMDARGQLPLAGFLNRFFREGLQRFERLCRRRSRCRFRVDRRGLSVWFCGIGKRGLLPLCDDGYGEQETGRGDVTPEALADHDSPKLLPGIFKL